MMIRAKKSLRLKRSFGSLARVKKALGQNFLKSQKALADIISTGNVLPTDVILEIGPGRGALTEKLLQKAGKVIAVEKDSELIELLKEKFFKEIKSGKLILLEKDILDFNINEIITSTPWPRLEYKIIANIPYYITGAIIRKFMETDHQPERMVLLIQKEVAERIVAKNRKESILSVSVKAYGQPIYIDTVKKRYFSPVPKVDSAILLIANISKKFFTNNGLDEKKFFELIKAGFAHKRKMLASNLKTLLGSFASQWLEKCRINKKARAEDLKIEDWICLTNEICGG